MDSSYVYQIIADDLRTAISIGKYGSDEQIPSENSLASHYNTSRVTVRKALHILENEGLNVKVLILPDDHDPDSYIRTYGTKAFIDRVGEAKLREAMEKDDAEALKQAFSEGGVEVTDEQLDYIAGGMSAFADFSDTEVSCMFPGLSCVPD